MANPPPAPTTKDAIKSKNITTEIKYTTSSTSRQQNGVVNNFKQVSQTPYIFKLFNPTNPSDESNKHLECITKKAFNYNPIKK